MSRYNMSDKFNPKYRYTLKGLSREIVSAYHGFDANDYQFVYRRITNSSDNGIIQRLNKILSYDINENSKICEEYKFEKFQLLYMIYRLIYEKNSIIELLAKPRMQNVNSIFSDSCIYGSVFEDMITELAQNTDPEYKKYLKLYQINMKWQTMLRRITFEYSAADDVLIERRKHLLLLGRIKEFFCSVLELMETFNDVPKDIPDKGDFKCKILKYRNGVNETFLNIIYVHYHLCYDLEVVRLSEPIHFKPNEAYWKAFEKMEFQMFQIKNIYEMIDYLKHPKKRIQNSYFDEIISFIRMGLEECNSKDIQYALEHINPILEMLADEKLVDFSKEIDVTLFISIIQEIIYVHKNNIKLKIDTLGYTTGSKSLSKILSSGYETNPAIVRIAWENRISNRVSLNFNLHNHILKAREIENLIYKIKKEVYSLINLQDIKFLTDIIITLFERAEKEFFYENAGEEAKFILKNVLDELKKTNGDHAIIKK